MEMEDERFEGEHLSCSENIKNHIFYYADSNYGAFTYMEKESEEKN